MPAVAKAELVRQRDLAGTTIDASSGVAQSPGGGSIHGRSDSSGVAAGATQHRISSCSGFNPGSGSAGACQIPGGTRFGAGNSAVSQAAKSEVVPRPLLRSRLTKSAAAITTIGCRSSFISL